MNPSRLLALFLLAATLPLTAQQIQISKENKTIAINTSDDATALADTAVVTVGFHSFGKDQDETYADATRISNAIATALSAAGLPKEAIQSVQQALSPIEPNGDENKIRYAQGIRFEFSQSWHVTVPADQAANVLHLAITAGANDSGDIQWQLKNDDSLQAEAASKALEHARQIAERMAEGLGFGNVMLNAENAMSAAMGGRIVNLKPLAISPERITKSATVYAVFAIQ